MPYGMHKRPSARTPHIFSYDKSLRECGVVGWCSKSFSIRYYCSQALSYNPCSYIFMRLHSYVCLHKLLNDYSEFISLQFTNGDCSWNEICKVGLIKCEYKPYILSLPLVENEGNFFSKSADDDFCGSHRIAERFKHLCKAGLEYKILSKFEISIFTQLDIIHWV